MMEPVEYRWSGMVMETTDGLAFIGRNPMDKDNVYIATGDSGMGMTHGTIAGILLTDLILGRENPWAEIYDPSRKPVWGMAWKEFLVENANVAEGVRQGLARRRRRRLRRGDPTRGGSGHPPRPEEGRRLPRRPRRRARALGGLPSPGLHRALERRREDLGLPLPRLPIRSQGPGHRRPGQFTTLRGLRSGTRGSDSATGCSWAISGSSRLGSENHRS